MPGIRFGMASNDGSWFAAFRRGTPPGVSRVVIYIRYIPGTRLGLLQGFRVTYVATWREKTIFEDISSSPTARWSWTRGRCLFRRERRQISPTERILKSRSNDFREMHGGGEAAGRMIVFCMQTILVLCFSYFFVVSYFKNKCSFIRYNFEIIRLEWNKLKGHVNISIVKRFKNTFWYFIFCCFWLKMGTKLFILCIFYIVIYILHYVSPRLYDNVGTF